MFVEQLFRLNGAPTYQIDVKTTEHFGQVLYREYNRGNPLFLDEFPVTDVINTFEDFIQVQVNNQQMNINEIQDQYATLTISKYSKNMILQQIKLKSGEGLIIIENDNWFLQGTIADYKEGVCMFALKIIDSDYEYVKHWNSNQSMTPFEFETIHKQSYLIIVFDDCQLYLYNETPIKHSKVKCLSYIEYLIQLLHYTNFHEYTRIEFTNTLPKKAFMDQFLLKSDVHNWIAQDLEYEDNLNYQLFKQIRYQEEISYQIPEIFIALGQLSKHKYIYIHNQSIEGECLFGQITFGSMILNLEISPSQHFVYLYNHEEPTFSLRSSIWRNRSYVPDYKIELKIEDKKKLANKIKLKGKNIKGRYIYATKKMLYVLFHQIRIVELTNLIVNDVIGDYSEMNDVYLSDEFSILRFIPKRQQEQYSYKFEFL